MLDKVTELTRYNHYIGGEFVEPSGGEWLDSDNPFTGKPWA